MVSDGDVTSTGIRSERSRAPKEYQTTNRTGTTKNAAYQTMEGIASAYAGALHRLVGPRAAMVVPPASGYQPPALALASAKISSMTTVASEMTWVSIDATWSASKKIISGRSRSGASSLINLSIVFMPLW